MTERPLSPHLQVYRLPVTAVLSITHRFTGVVLAVGMVLFVVVLMAVAEGEARYAPVGAFLRAPAGRLIIWIWLYALFFHLCHGIRHLVWDTGHGFDKAALNRQAWLELAASILLTGVLFFGFGA